MSRSVDERIVQMQFDNQQFERGCKQTMGTLEKLKNALNFGDSVKSLNQVEEAGRCFALTGVEQSIRQISDRFSMLGIIGITALQNITNKAMDTGTQLVKSLSVDQIAAGWEKYGQKTASVQTIMNATGKSIDEVNGYLSKLMWFSDETSYGFTDMTAALGQLTSAGGEIDKLIPMIEGIANATAYAGKGASEFSRVIYNLNQSYSQGYLSLMDWKSVSLAGVDSKELKQTIIDTAVAMGNLKKKADGTYRTAKGTLVNIGTFQQTLAEKWADTAVMEQSFAKFAEMTEKAYEMVQNGEAETATEAYKMLSEQFEGVSITAANAAQEAKTFGEAIDATKDAVSSGWMRTFELIFGNYVEAKELWTELSEALWEVFASGSSARNEMFSIWKESGGRKVTIQAVRDLCSGLANLAKIAKGAFEAFFPETSTEKKALSLVKITKIVSEIAENFKNSTAIAGSFRVAQSDVVDKLYRTFKGLVAIVDIVKQVFSALFHAVSPVFGITKDLGGSVLDLTANLGDWLVMLDETIKKNGVLTTISNSLASGISTIYTKIKEFIALCASGLPSLEQIRTFFTTLAKNSGGYGAISVVMSAIGQAITAFINGFANLDFSNILSVLTTLTAGSLLNGLRKAISGFNKAGDGFSSFGSNIKEIMEIATDSFKAFSQSIKAKTLKELAISIGILAVSLAVIASIDSDKLTGALVGITVLMGEMLGSMQLMQGMKLKGVSQIGAIMLALSVAVLILSAALKNISSIDSGAMFKGVAGLTFVIGELVAAMRLMEGHTKGFAGTGVAMIAIATSMLIFAQSIKKIGELDTGVLIQGIIGIGAVLAEMVGFQTLMNKFGGKGAVGNSVALIAMGAAMLIFANSISQLGNMELEVLAKGIGAIAATLTVLAVAMRFMKGTAGASASLLIIAAALAVLTPVLKSLGEMTLEEIGKSLLALAGAFVVIGAAAAVLSPIIPSILGLAGAIALLGVGVLGIGVGLMAFSSALILLGGSSAAVAVGIGTLVSVIPVIAKSLAAGLVEFAKGVAESAPVLAESATVILQEFIGVIVASIPEITEGAFQLLIAMCDTIAENLPLLIEKGTDMIIALMDGIQESIPRLVDKTYETIIAFVNAISDGVAEHEAELIKSIIGLGKNIIAGLIEGLLGGVADVLQSIWDIGGDIVQGFKDFFDIHSPSVRMKKEIGYYVVDGVAEGITERDTAEEAARKKAANITNAFKTELSKVDLSNTTLDLELKLAKLLEGENNVDVLTYQQNKLKNAEHTMLLAESEYRATLEEFGKENDHTQEAYNKLLQAQINYTELTQSLEETKKTQMAQNRNAMVAYAEWIAEYKDVLTEQGFTMEQIEAAAQENTGFNPAPVTDEMKSSVQTAVSSAMGTVKTAYTQAAVATFGGLSADVGSYGVQYAESFSKGFQDGSTKMYDSIISAMDRARAALANQSEAWYETAQRLMDGFIDGLNSKMEQARSLISELSSFSIISSIGGASGPSYDLAVSSADTSYDMAAQIAGNSNASAPIGSSVSGGNVTNVNFTQNNYSPKALDPITHYRNTQTVLAVIEATK